MSDYSGIISVNDLLQNADDEHIQIGWKKSAGGMDPGIPVFLSLAGLHLHGIQAGGNRADRKRFIQVLAEELSNSGVPVLVADVAGAFYTSYISGILYDNISAGNLVGNPSARSPQMPTMEILSMDGEAGVSLRAAVADFGPLLMGMLLGLNVQEERALTEIFRYCSDRELPANDLERFSEVIRHLQSEDYRSSSDRKGDFSMQSLDWILAKVTELKRKGGEVFFGENTFDVEDLIHITEDGRGVVNLLRAPAKEDKVGLMAVFVLQMLIKLFLTLPDVGSAPKPKLVVMVNDAHRLFAGLDARLTEQMNTVLDGLVVKGVGVYFSTPHPEGIPESVRIRTEVKIQQLTTNRVDSDETLWEISERKGPELPALITMCAPATHLGMLSDEDVERIVASSRLTRKYNQPADERSAYQIVLADIAGSSEKMRVPEDKLS